MANIEIQKYLTLGNNTPLIATSYQVALDSDFTNIIDEIVESREFKLKWYTPLLKNDGSGRCYGDEETLYARVKLFLEDDDGELYAPDDWFVLPVESQIDFNLAHRTYTYEEETII